MSGSIVQLAVSLVLALPAGAVAADLTRNEALALAYPQADVRMEQVFLTENQQMEAADRATVKVPSALVVRYIATRDGRVVGRAYVDTAVVRTKSETLLISLDEGGRVRRVDVTAFLEPAEYQAPEAWLRQYTDRPLGDQLAVNRAIRPIAGATLTARAVNDAVRRVLAIDGVLRSGGAR